MISFQIPEYDNSNPGTEMYAALINRKNQTETNVNTTTIIVVQRGCSK